MIHAEMTKQVLSVLDGRNQQRRMIGKQGTGMGFERNGSGGATQFLRVFEAGLQQRLMTNMNTVKKTQCVNSFLFSHKITDFKSDFEKTFNG